MLNDMPKSPTHATRQRRALSTGSSSVEKIRTCPGCQGVFRRSSYLRHVRNDCGDMISVPQLHAALEGEANKSGFEVITYIEVCWIIQRLVASRLGPYDLTAAANIPDEDIIDLTDINETVDAIEAAVQGETSAAEQDIDAVTAKVADMDL